MKGGQHVLGQRCKGDGMVHRIDTSDPGWWRSLAACRDVVPPHDDEALPGMGGEAMTEGELAQWRVGLFFPGDGKRTGPETQALKAACIAEVRNGVPVELVAMRHGCTAREVRYWLTASAKRDWQRHNKTRRTTERPGEDVAKAVCAGCPVRGECLEEALERNEQEGIWGGLNTEERRMEVRRRRAVAAA